MYTTVQENILFISSVSKTLCYRQEFNLGEEFRFLVMYNLYKVVLVEVFSLVIANCTLNIVQQICATGGVKVNS